MGGIVTRQALWKYERGKARPSALVIGKLSEALGVRTVSLWGEPSVRVRFVAYRKGSGLLKREQDRVRGAVALSIEDRIRLNERINGNSVFMLPCRKFQ